MNQGLGKLCRSAIVMLLSYIGVGYVVVARAAAAGDTQIWFGMGPRLGAAVLPAESCLDGYTDEGQRHGRADTGARQDSRT